MHITPIVPLLVKIGKTQHKHFEKSKHETFQYE